MSTVESTRDGTGGWRRTACRYAERFGWPVVPLHPGAEHAEVEDPAIEQLGHRPLVDVPDGASAQPEVIRGWTGIPRHAPLGLLTGADSQIAALEIPEAENTTLTSTDLQRLREAVPDTRRIDGPRRTYHLFSRPSELDLPRCTPFSDSHGGLVLHGDQSVIRVPNSIHSRDAYRWDWTSPDEFASFPESLLSFFGVRVDAEALREWQETLTGASGSSPESSSHSSGEGSTLTFRSGAQLEATAEDASRGIGLPGLAPGTLSVLSGPPKTAGKSTFVLNLAAHLAAGHPFLGFDQQPTRVVMWSDLPASRFREHLQQIGIGPEARARLHVLHPRDAAPCSWQGLLARTFDHAVRENAGLLLLDSLDQFVQVKGEREPTKSAELAHMLTTEAPSECAVLAVKALRIALPVRMEDVVERLGLLGTAADLVLQMDRGPTRARPTLRRLQWTGRLSLATSHFLCEMVRGRYRRLQSEKRSGWRERQIDVEGGDLDPPELDPDRDTLISSRSRLETATSSSRRRQ